MPIFTPPPGSPEPIGLSPSSLRVSPASPNPPRTPIPNPWAIPAGYLFPPAPRGWTHARLKRDGPPLPYPLTGRGDYAEMGLILAGYLGDLRSQAYYFKLMRRWREGSLGKGMDRAKLWLRLRDKAIELGHLRWPHGNLHRPGAVFCTWVRLMEGEGDA